MAKVIETKIGFKCEISEEALDDWELFEKLRDVDNGKLAAIIDVAPMLLGDEQYNNLKELIREKCGKVKASVMVDTIREIIESEKETKNS